MGRSPDRSRHKLRHSDRPHRERPKCRGRRRSRRLGEQPVRRRARTDRSEDESGGGADQPGKPSTRTGDVGRQRARRPPPVRRRSSRRDPQGADDRSRRLDRHRRRLHDDIVAHPAHDQRRPGRLPTRLVSREPSSFPTSPSRSRPRPTAARRTFSGCGRTSGTRAAGQSKASDFRAPFERDFEIAKLYGGYYNGIVGAARCEKNRKRCDLSPRSTSSCAIVSSTDLSPLVPSATGSLGVVTSDITAPFRRHLNPYGDIRRSGTPVPCISRTQDGSL
jgi:hypothetical protein